MSRPSSRPMSATRIRAALLGSDLLAQGAAFTFALAPLYRDDGRRTFILLVTWILLPHLIAAGIRGGGWPRGRIASTITALLLGSTVIGLGFVGWELLRTPSHDGDPIFGGTAALALLSWASALLLFIPPSYRVHDFLGGGVILMGLLEQRPDALILVPLYALGVALSSAFRHRLFDLKRGEDTGLPSPGRLALTGGAFALVIGGIFAGLSALLFPLLDADRLADEAAPRSALRAPDANQRRREERGGSNPEATAREIGFPEVVRLAELSEARGNPTPVFTIKPLSPRAEGSPPPELRNRLWRIVAFESFDPRRLQWNSFDRTFERRDWKPRGIVRPAEARRHPRQADFEFRIETLVFRNLVLPYGWERLRPPEPRDALSHYFTDGRSGLVPRRPQLAVDTHWVCRFDPEWTPGLRLPEGTRSPRQTAPENLAVPGASELGFDLAPLAREIFGEARGIEAKVEALRDFFRREIRYDLTLDWLPPDRNERFATFIGEARSGDCMYFATAAALLLRTARVPARFVAGFAGVDWDDEAGHWIVRQSHAHAWIEVQTAGGRWLPLDPVTWTPGGAERGPLPAVIARSEPEPTLELRPFPDLALLGLAALLLALGLWRRRAELTEERRHSPPEEATGELAPRLEGLLARARRRSPSDPTAILVHEYERLQDRLRRRRLHRRPEETLREHERRIAERDPEAAEPLGFFTTLLDRALFGRRPPTAEELESARDLARGRRRP